jgi:superoxide reductase
MIRFFRAQTSSYFGGMKVLSEEFSLTKLNKPADWTNLTVMDKKHVPIIEAPAKVKANTPFAVKIKVGGIDGVEHPNTLSHWINWVALYAGERWICRAAFAPEMTDKYVVTFSVTLSASATLRAQLFCNLHGVWEGKTKQVTVE